MNRYINDFTPTVRTYYKELKKCNPIAKSAELELIKKAKNNNVLAKNQLLTANLKFVFNVAKNYKGCGVSIEDLISEGNMGLIKAIDKFDINRDVKFISYAVWWIRQSIQEFLKKKQTKDSFELLDDDNKKPKIVNSFDDEINDEDEFDSRMVLIDDTFSNQLDGKQKTIINNLLSKLDERAQFIIKSYYGFDSDCMTLEEIGKKLNLSRERVRKIKEKNLRILRSELLLMDDFSEFF